MNEDNAVAMIMYPPDLYDETVLGNRDSSYGIERPVKPKVILHHRQWMLAMASDTQYDGLCDSYRTCTVLIIPPPRLLHVINHGY
jgi:hypothetical protein